VTEPDFQSFEAVGALVVVLDVEGRIVHWNRFCSNLMGYSLDEVRGRHLWDFLLVPDDVEPVKAVVAALRAGEHAPSHANYWVTKSDERRWIVFSHTVTAYPDGRVQYIIKTGIEQTDTKHLEEALRASEAKLSVRAVESARLYEDARRATEDLREANQNMVAATIRAQEVTEKVEAALTRSEETEHELRAVAEFREMFIGIVGHDLRNPLGTISLLAEMLLQRGRLDEHDREGVSRIVASCQRMSRMILQLFDFTRARLGGGFPIDPKPGDLGDICRIAVEEFGAAAALEREGDLTGSWDADRLTEALSNMVGNGIDHALPGTPVVVRAYPQGAEAVVEISNQGNEIPADVRPLIFEPFRRGKDEKTKVGNLGLGLYIARQIALASGGTLDLRSGGGTTTFVMRLPRQAASERPLSPIASRLRYRLRYRRAHGKCPWRRRPGGRRQPGEPGPRPGDAGGPGVPRDPGRRRRAGGRRVRRARPRVRAARRPDAAAGRSRRLPSDTGASGREGGACGVRDRAAGRRDVRPGPAGRSGRLPEQAVPAQRAHGARRGGAAAAEDRGRAKRPLRAGQAAAR
jgi:PAS domain S-box-containing protein